MHGQACLKGTDVSFKAICYFGPETQSAKNGSLCSAWAFRALLTDTPCGSCLKIGKSLRHARSQSDACMKGCRALVLTSGSDVLGSGRVLIGSASGRW